VTASGSFIPVDVGLGLGDTSLTKITSSCSGGVVFVVLVCWGLDSSSDSDSDDDDDDESESDESDDDDDDDDDDDGRGVRFLLF
jgi:hypothetical protein